MSTLTNFDSPEFSQWIESFKGSKDLMEKAKNDPAVQQRKQDALAALEEYKSQFKGEAFQEVVKKLEQAAPEIKEKVEQMVYEGTFSDDALQSFMVQNGILKEVDPNLVTACNQCITCTSCSACALCLLSGAVAALAITSVGAAATHEYSV